jgi:ribonuclease P protein component
MHGEPRAASAWPSDSGTAGSKAWPKSRRLLRASEFASFTGTDVFWRGARRWISISARLRDSPAGREAAPRGNAGASAAAMSAAVRFGLTVSRRHARRAVARSMVRRVLREAARNAAARLEHGAAGRRFDILLRLKATLPSPEEAGWDDLKAQLRLEADVLLDELAQRLAARRAPAARNGHGGPLAKSAAGAEIPAADPEGAQP